MSNMSRRKGARVENDIAHALQRHGIAARKRSKCTSPVTISICVSAGATLADPDVGG
jgi:Holliday junction resolvase